MKEIIINSNNKNKPYGLPKGVLSFSILSSPINGDKQVQDFFWCRDYLNDLLIGFYNDRNNNKWTKGQVPPDTNKLKLLVAKDFVTEKEKYEKEFKENLKRAVKILNLYEKLAGFSIKSKLLKVKFEDFETKHQVYLIAGPGEWVKSSHTLSMVTLIVRVIANYGYTTPVSKIRNLKSIETHFKSKCEYIKTLKSYHLDTDLATYLPKSYPKFRKIMKNYNELFGKFTPQECNPLTHMHNWHSPGGIYSFCSYQTNVKDITERAKKYLD